MVSGSASVQLHRPKPDQLESVLQLEVLERAVLEQHVVQQQPQPPMGTPWRGLGKPQSSWAQGGGPSRPDPAGDRGRAAGGGKEGRFGDLPRRERRTILGDPARLRQVLQNLLENAVKFTPREGRVEIAVARGEAGVELRVLRVLLVDDVADTRELAGASIRRSGAEVELAASVTNALEGAIQLGWHGEIAGEDVEVSGIQGVRRAARNSHWHTSCAPESRRERVDRGAR
jgi:CheY-like chemotaxis protein